jgi:hypothetical protein
MNYVLCPVLQNFQFACEEQHEGNILNNNHVHIFTSEIKIKTIENMSNELILENKKTTPINGNPERTKGTNEDTISIQLPCV